MEEQPSKSGAQTKPASSSPQQEVATTPAMMHVTRIKVGTAADGRAQMQEPAKNPAPVPAAGDPHKTRIKDLDGTLMFLRRLYHVYFFMLSTIFIFVMGLNFMIQIFFSLFQPQVSHGRNFFFVAFGLMCLILLLAYLVGNLITFNFMLITDSFALDEFVLYRKVVSFDDGLLNRWAEPGSVRSYVDKTLQVFIILTIDVLPLVLAVVLGTLNNNGTSSTDYFFLTAILACTGHVVLFWLAALIKDFYDKFAALKIVFRDPKVVKHLLSMKKSMMPFSKEEDSDPESSIGRAAAAASTYGAASTSTETASGMTVSPSAASFASASTPQSGKSSSTSLMLIPRRPQAVGAVPTSSSLMDATREKIGEEDVQDQQRLHRVLSSMRKPQTDEDKLNVCVNLSDLLGATWMNRSVKLAVVGLVVAVAVIAALLGYVLLCLLALFVFIIGFIFWLNNFVASHAPPLEHHDPGPLFEAMSAFFRKHCGVQRYLMLRFSVTMSILSILFGIVSIVAQLWTCLAIDAIFLAFVLLIAVSAFKFPHYMWTVIFFECVFFMLTALINNFAVFGAAVGGITLFLVVVTQVFLTRKLQRTFTILAIVVFTFLVVAAVVFSIGFYASAQAPNSRAAGSLVVPHNKPAYEFCSRRWDGLSIVDFTMMSALAYDTGPGVPNSDFSADLQMWFPGWQVMGSDLGTGPMGGVTFVDLFNAQQNLTVIAVRGTASASDVIQDMDIWLSITLFQAASVVGPTLLQPATATIIYYGTFMKRAVRSPSGRFYYDNLNTYVQSTLATRNGTMYITGHSLGGGLSKIIAAQNSIQAITISAPGLYYTSASVGIQQSDLRRYGVTLKPQNDVVPRVDQIAGTVVQTDCVTSVPSCHKVTYTLCELLRSCGDPQGGRGVSNQDKCPPGYF